MNKKLGLAGIVVAVLIGGIFVFNKSKPYAQDNIQASQVQKELDLAKDELMVSNTTSIYSSIDDKEFVAFAQTKIESKCPFYVPDGSTYRECLSGWVEVLQKNVPSSDQQSIGLLCETFVSKNSEPGSLEAGELYAKCLIYRLSKL